MLRSFTSRALGLAAVRAWRALKAELID